MMPTSPPAPTPPCCSRGLWRNSILAGALSLALGMGGAGGAWADEPIVIGNDQIGMTAEGMAAPEPPPEAPAQNEWRASPSDLESGAATAPSALAGPMASSYAECVELAVKAGNPFSASSGVCQAIFPEDAASDGAAQAVSATVPKLDEAPADEPIVLKLHGPPPIAPSAEPTVAAEPSESAEKAASTEPTASADPSGTEGAAPEARPAPEG